MRRLNPEQFEAHLQTELHRAHASGHLDAIIQIQQGIQAIYQTPSEVSYRVRITDFLNTAIISSKQHSATAYAQDGL